MTFIYLNFTLFLFLLALVFGPNRFVRLYKNLTLLIVLYIWILSINLWLNCSWFGGEAVFIDTVLDGFNIHCLFKLDTLSLFFVLLTTFIFPFCILSVWDLPLVRVIFFNLLLIELLLILTFTVFDLFLFCLFFEALLIPMFFIILWWGARLRRIKALTYFFIYTLFGSLFLFLALFVVYFETGATSFFSIHIWVMSIGSFWAGNFLLNFLWVLFFLVFAIKVPMFPFHIWLPEAHVEAPTVGSVILAAILLKLGGYGIVRFLYIFSFQFFYWQSFTFYLVLLSVWLASISALRQLDLKRTIAYSSIAHMNFALAGFFSNSVLGVVGGFSMLISHGFVSAALFLLIGYIYDRYHTRTIPYYGGLVQVMPLWVFFFFIFIISNFSFPGTSNFIGEVLIFIGIGSSDHSFMILLVLGLSTLLTVSYSLFLFNRVSFGSLKMQYIKAFSDLNRREVMLIVPLFFINFFFGLVPNFFIAPIYHAVLVYCVSPDALYASDFMFEKNKPNTRMFLNSADDLAVKASVDLGLIHQQFWAGPLNGVQELLFGGPSRVWSKVSPSSYEDVQVVFQAQKDWLLWESAVEYLERVHNSHVFSEFDIRWHSFYDLDENTGDLAFQYYLAIKASPETLKFFFMGPLYWFEEIVLLKLSMDISQFCSEEVLERGTLFQYLSTINQKAEINNIVLFTPRVDKKFMDFAPYHDVGDSYDDTLLDREIILKFYYKPYLLHEKEIAKELETYLSTS